MTTSAPDTSVLAGVCDDVATAGPADDVDGVAPVLVARPHSTQEVSGVMAAAAAHGWRVVPRGRGSKLTWGMPPSGVELVLDLSAMDQVLDHQAGDLIVATQAGSALSAVQNVVGEQRQRLALDETVPGASIGGTLASNTSGPLRVGFGTARDLLIGVTVVRADGVVAKAGGRVVKNVAGYDLGKLLIGSFGTLGVVTEALFRLHPRPETRRWVTVPVADPEQAFQRVAEVLHAQCMPAAVEVRWSHRTAGEGSGPGGPGGPGSPGSVATLLEGREDGVRARVETVTRLWGSSARPDAEAPTGVYPWDVAAAGDDRATALKLTFALSGLADVLGAVLALPVPVEVRGSAGTGVVHAAVPAGTPVPDVATAVQSLREVCTRRGGAVVVLDAPAGVKQAVDLWGPVAGLALMRSVKDRFDPDRRLSPGRFVGGI